MNTSHTLQTWKHKEDLFGPYELCMVCGSFANLEDLSGHETSESFHRPCPLKWQTGPGLSMEFWDQHYEPINGIPRPFEIAPLF